MNRKWERRMKQAKKKQEIREMSRDHNPLVTDAYYMLFQAGIKKVKRSNGGFGCPFSRCECNNVDYDYANLLQHAVQVGEGPTPTDMTQRSKHSAMARYLAVDLAAELQQAPTSGRKQLRSGNYEQNNVWNSK